MLRRELANFVPDGGVAIELGVATGLFSVELLEQNPNIYMLYSVDKWTGEGHHADKNFRIAANRLMTYKDRNIILRMTFGEASRFLMPKIFDLIYIDGYAHTGQQNGETLETWWRYLKPGGVFAGHDYDSKWPKVVEVVNAFAEKHEVSLQITDDSQIYDAYTRSQCYNSWFIRT